MILLCTVGAKAQIGDGFDYAMNLGGVGSGLVDMQYDTNGNLYFVADMYGKSFFAGQQIDAGGTGSFPPFKHIYGKISANGTQTLLKVFAGAVYCKISNSGELYGIIKSGYPFFATDYGDGFTDAAYGAKMIKISNTGVTQWIKPFDPGSSWEYGKSGQALEVANIQITTDGNVYIATNANQVATNPPNATFQYPHRIAKYNSDGIEVWHTDVFTDSYSASILAPNQFVNNNGKVTFGLFTNGNRFYYNGEEITSQMSKTTISSSMIISLNADGTKNFTIADVSRNTNTNVILQAVNPFNGDIFVAYQAYFAIPENAPYNTFPTSTPNPYSSSYIGIINFNSSGTYLKYDNNNSSGINYKSLKATNNGFVNIIGKSYIETYSKGSYIFTDTKDFGVVEIYDQDFNFSKAVKVPYVDKLSVAGFQDKVAIGGTFLTPLTIGNTTLTPQYNDTNFGTRFPYYAGFKSDIFFAQADASTVTPITLLSFSGVKTHSGIKLNWVTATEKNSAYFEIEKSTDGQLFTTLGRVNAAGNSSVSKYYSLTDFIPANGTNYYRLKQVDLDGKTDLSRPVSINFDLDASSGISIYPNPASSEVHFKGIKIGSTVILYDTDGKRILTQKVVNNSLKLPSEVKNGLYVLSIQASDGTTTALKVSISK